MYVRGRCTDAHTKVRFKAAVSMAGAVVGSVEICLSLASFRLCNVCMYVTNSVSPFL
jgi:hypothetical protein